MRLSEQDTLEGEWYTRNSIRGYKGQPETQKHGLSGNGNYWVVTVQAQQSCLLDG